MDLEFTKNKTFWFVLAATGVGAYFWYRSVQDDNDMRNLYAQGKFPPRLPQGSDLDELDLGEFDRIRDNLDFESIPMDGDDDDEDY